MEELERDIYTVTITLIQDGETVTAHAISEPMIKMGENIQPVHLIAQEMLALRFNEPQEENE